MNITFEQLYKAMRKNMKGVSWKRSVSVFLNDDISNLIKLQEQIENGTYKEAPHRYFKIYSPKERQIMSLTFRDRIYQRVLNDDFIYPIMSKGLIYDNLACQKGKGTDRARNRLIAHLQKFYRENNNSNNGFVVQIDIKKYYPSMNHDVVLEIFKKKLPQDIYFAVEDILSNFKMPVGFHAGSQIIQIAGISLLNDCDHYMKEQMHLKHYQRYMDDIIILCKTFEEAQYYLKVFQEQAEKVKCQLHPTKTKIYPINEGIDYLGFNFKLKSNGTITKAILKKSLAREKKHLKIITIMYKYKIPSPRSQKYFSKEMLDNHIKLWSRFCQNGRKRSIIKNYTTYFKNLLLTNFPKSLINKTQSKYKENNSYFNKPILVLGGVLNE